MIELQTKLLTLADHKSNPKPLVRCSAATQFGKQCAHQVRPDHSATVIWNGVAWPLPLCPMHANRKLLGLFDEGGKQVESKSDC